MSVVRRAMTTLSMHELVHVPAALMFCPALHAAVLILMTKTFHGRCIRCLRSAFVPCALIITEVYPPSTVTSSRGRSDEAIVCAVLVR